jgi:hypothetical protein
MNDSVKTATLVGDPIDIDAGTSTSPPKSRSERIREYRDAHHAEYRRACDSAQCTCAPTRAEALIMAQYDNPPID